MNLANEAREILERSGYRVFLKDASTLQFESNTIIGFAVACQSGEEISNVWRDKQARFLRDNAQVLRQSGLKAWNVYSVFLAESSAYSETRGALLNIEEDFQSTRKIAQSNLASAADVVRALLPLLPIQSLVQLRDDDPISRLRARVGERVVSALQRVESTEELITAFLNLK